MFNASSVSKGLNLQDHLSRDTEVSLNISLLLKHIYVISLIKKDDLNTLKEH